MMQTSIFYADEGGQFPGALTVSMTDDSWIFEVNDTSDDTDKVAGVILGTRDVRRLAKTLTNLLEANNSGVQV